jgi:hypothetical protein
VREELPAGREIVFVAKLISIPGIDSHTIVGKFAVIARWKCPIRTKEWSAQGYDSRVVETVEVKSLEVWRHLVQEVLQRPINVALTAISQKPGIRREFQLSQTPRPLERTEQLAFLERPQTNFIVVQHAGKEIMIDIHAEKP